MHDLSIMDYVLPAQPVAVSATGIGHVPGEPENIAYLTLHFDAQRDRARPRQLARAGEGAPDADRRQPQDDRLRRPRAEREDQGLRQGHHAQRASAPANGDGNGKLRDARRLPHRRHVGAAARHDRGARARSRVTSSTASNNQTPIADGQAGLRVVRMLEAATESMRAARPCRRTCYQQVRSMIPFVDLKAQYLDHQDRRSTPPSARVLDTGQFVLGDGSRGVRAGVRRLLRRRARHRGQHRHQRAAPRAARRRRRARRRGHHRAVHLRRHRRRDRLHRRARRSSSTSIR